MNDITTVENKLETIELTQEDIKRFSWTLSDAICWLNGFRAGNPDCNFPIHISDLSDLNIKLKDKWDI